MKLLVKFNVILGIILSTGLLFTLIVAHIDLEQSAERQMRAQAQLMMFAAQATRDYTAKDIKPLLAYGNPVPGKESETGPGKASNPETAPRFYHQSVPAYAARKTFENLQERILSSEGERLKNLGQTKEKIEELLAAKRYGYKEASDNPTNYRDKCDDFEKQLIDEFRLSKPPDPIFRNHVGVDGMRYWVLAQPMFCQQECLSCHDKPDSPEAKIMLASDPNNYKPTDGFGWKVDDVVAVQMVRIPASEIETLRDAMFNKLVFNLVVVSIAAIVSLNAGLIWFIIRPVNRLSSWAVEVSTGDLTRGKLPVKGRDEIATLTESFNRMYVSLLSAMNMLKKSRK
jgi:methyl-accepting chemotaxis protein